MKVKVSREKIWWYVGNDNKPSDDYMHFFKSRMEDLELKVNFNSLDSVEIVCSEKNKDITYISFTHNGMDLFYIVQGIDKVLNKGYVYILQLDIWNTFTLPYLMKLRNINADVLSIRSHLFNDLSVQYEDELLDSCFKQYESVNFDYNPYNYKDGFYYDNKNGYNAISDKGVNGSYCYVFKQKTGTDYLYIPLLSKSGSIDIKVNNKIERVDNSLLYIHSTELTWYGSFILYTAYAIPIPAIEYIA